MLYPFLPPAPLTRISETAEMPQPRGVAGKFKQSARAQGISSN